MRITLSGAMRARDVSRPRDEQLAAAAEREARTTTRAGRPGGAVPPRGPGSAGPAGATSTGPSGADEADAPQAPQAPQEADRADRNAMNAMNEPVSPDRAADDLPSPARRRRHRGR
jgi:hypothetical protein